MKESGVKESAGEEAFSMTAMVRSCMMGNGRVMCIQGVGLSRERTRFFKPGWKSWL